MLYRLNKSVLTSLMITLLAGGSLPVRADVSDNLPDIGTTAGSTLSINQELEMGDFYLRQMRGSAPMINDPLLSQYINQLGQRLVAHAWSVKTPFHIFLIGNDDINAFAFFGGNVVLYTSLFRYSDNESQLASVLAHEISHVTQRHLARAMESQQRNAPLTWVGALGSILLAMASPQAGMAALSGTLAGARQGVITFTQQNEQEADRIGIQVLQRAGFDPEGMPNFLQKLADASRYATAPPKMLLTHPLPASRLADARNRASQMRPMVVQSSQDFWLAKVRAQGMFSGAQNQLTDDMLTTLSRGNSREQIAARYGRAILQLNAKQFAAARDTLAPLLAKQPDNIWFLDLMTDIDIGLHQPMQAVNRLLAVKGISASSPILQLNLANAWLEAKQPASASKVLYRYTWANKDDTNGWDLLARACAQQGLDDEEQAARAEEMALHGQLDQAIRSLSSASALVPLGSLKQARYDARIDQLRQLQQRFKQYQK